MVAELEEVQIMDKTSKTEYCCGLMFEGDNVALIRKLRPAEMKNKLNGIGGHIESGEPSVAAQVREFFEETGYKTTTIQWWPFAVIRGADRLVHFFCTRGKLSELRSTTDEEIVIKRTNDLGEAVVNLNWLMPMALNIFSESVYSYHIIEEKY